LARAQAWALPHSNGLGEALVPEEAW
jgi:hypothetical protein